MNKETRTKIFLSVMHDLNLSQADVIEKTGKSKSEVSRYCGSERLSIPVKTFETFIKQFNVDISKYETAYTVENKISIVNEPPVEFETIIDTQNQTEMNDNEIIKELNIMLIRKDKEVERLKKELNDCQEARVYTQ